MPGETPLPQADTPEDDHDMYLPASHAWQIGFQMAFFVRFHHLEESIGKDIFKG